MSSPLCTYTVAAEEEIPRIQPRWEIQENGPRSISIDINK
jgi:hypothetical protein